MTSILYRSFFYSREEFRFHSGCTVQTASTFSGRRCKCCMPPAVIFARDVFTAIAPQVAVRTTIDDFVLVLLSRSAAFSFVNKLSLQVNDPRVLAEVPSMCERIEELEASGEVRPDATGITDKFSSIARFEANIYVDSEAVCDEQGARRLRENYAVRDLLPQLAPFLRVLKLHFRTLQSAGFSAIGECKSLEILDLSFCEELENEVLERHIRKLPRLRCLNLCGAPMHGAMGVDRLGLASLCGDDADEERGPKLSLNTLAVGRRKSTQPLSFFACVIRLAVVFQLPPRPAVRSSLTGFRNLKRLEVHLGAFDANEVAGLCQCTQLMELLLDGCDRGLNRALFIQLGESLTQLVVLELVRSATTHFDVLPTAFQNVRTLLVERCHFRTAALHAIVQMPSLMLLDLVDVTTTEEIDYLGTVTAVAPLNLKRMSVLNNRFYEYSLYECMVMTNSVRQVWTDKDWTHQEGREVGEDEKRRRKKKD